VAALADDASREEFKGPVRKAFAAGLDRMVAHLQPMLGKRGKDRRRCTAGRVTRLARATKGQAVSDEFLGAARVALLDT
jgi:hypothetical protein